LHHCQFEVETIWRACAGYCYRLSDTWVGRKTSPCLCRTWSHVSL